MPLDVLLIMVVVGITGIVLLLHLCGRSRTPSLSDADMRREWARHFPDDPLTSLTLAQSGKSALVHSTQGPGLIWVFGADTVARPLHRAQLTQVPKGLRVTFNDPGVPPTTFTLTDAEATLWQREIETP